MDLEDYSQHPQKFNYFSKYPPVRDDHRYPDSSKLQFIQFDRNILILLFP